MQVSRPDIAAIDINLPGIDGWETAERLGDGFPDTLVPLVSMFGDASHRRRAEEVGARGFLVKTELRRVLVSSIWALCGGDTFSYQGDRMSAKPTIVLLHGAFQDGDSTWHKVKPELENHGFKVIIVNLPGRDGDGADPKTLTTDVYRETVLKAISDETDPVILVGHSFGGITISIVAEAAPDKLKALVYLSAYLPQDGQSLITLAQMDRDSYLGKPGNLVLAADYSVASIKEDQKAEIFGNDATDADKDAIAASLIPEPAAAQGMPVKLTDANFGRVPKFYIETTQDRTVSPFLQEQMISRTKLVKVTKVDAGHASYITQPAAVAVAIIEAAEHTLAAPSRAT